MGTTEHFDVFPGIGNENEFYSHHFFAHGFQARIKDWLQQQAAATAETAGDQPDLAPPEPPAKRLASLARAFFRQHAADLAQDDFDARLNWHRALHQPLLEALGYRIEKTPRAVCSSNKAYDCLDLTELPDDYLPRTNYLPDCSPAEYAERTPRVPWVEGSATEGVRVTGYYRLTSRTMIGSSSERTLQSCIALGWADIRELPAGVIVTKTFPDDTLPGGPVERTIRYQARSCGPIASRTIGLLGRSLQQPRAR